MSEERFKRAGAAVEELCRIMARLRAPDGCPWDREQTLQTLKAYLLEETYETLDAIDSGDPRKHCEELGDLLLQVVFQSEITQESPQGFGLAEVAEGIARKLLRRHPHVFGDVEARDAAGALRSWEQMKAAERTRDEGALHGVPRAMPALLRALRTGEKAAAVGFDWHDAAGVKAKVEEEWAELVHAMESGAGVEAMSEELGDMLFALTSLARHLTVNPEEALRRTLDKFQRRFEHVERRLAERNRAPGQATLDEMERLWEEAKLLERR